MPTRDEYLALLWEVRRHNNGWSAFLKVIHSEFPKSKTRFIRFNSTCATWILEEAGDLFEISFETRHPADDDVTDVAANMRFRAAMLPYCYTQRAPMTIDMYHAAMAYIMERKAILNKVLAVVTSNSHKHQLFQELKIWYKHEELLGKCQVAPYHDPRNPPGQ